MSVPTVCTVLVIGAGPGGSFAAAALAREGVDVVLLEADKFPRYHIGESMLASIRFFLRFIGLDEKFDQHGFNQKRGAAFKINEKQEGYTDFVAINGEGNHSWNVIRSEADDLIFRHAEACGAKVFDATKVTSIRFEPLPETVNDIGRPVSASWSRAEDGSQGVVDFDYLIDASGRAGIVSTKYMKNRQFNQSLKNLAQWSYWRGVRPYGLNTERQGAPLFEALDDGSGWVWNIPLHDGTMSVGVVMEQEVAVQKRRAMGSPSDSEFYQRCIQSAPMIRDLMHGAEMIGSCKTASNYSYSASCYSSPHLRIVGDAGCFIDPYFSSGVHLALSSSLSAVVTIQAARNADCDEATAAQWHNDKVKESYTVFLLIVLTTMKQIRAKLQPILSDWDEDGFDRAFAMYSPVIQGTADTKSQNKLTQEQLAETVEFAMHAFEKFSPELEARGMQLMSDIGNGKQNGMSTMELGEEEQQILRAIHARKMLQCEATLNLGHFARQNVNGLEPRLDRGNIGLRPVSHHGKDDGASEQQVENLTQETIQVVQEDVRVY